MNSIPKSVRVLWFALGATLLLGTAAYFHFIWTGRYEMLVLFFATAGVFFFLAAAGVEVYFAHLARSQFDISEPMHTAWALLFLSASCRFTGVFVTQILAPGDRWSLFSAIGLPQSHSMNLRQAGIVLAGPVAMALMVAGLASVIRLTRRLQILRSISKLDLVAICVILMFTGRHLFEVGVIITVNRAWPGVAQALLWFSDPLLTVLIIQAVLIRRAVLNMGNGLIAACWRMIALGAMFTSIGDVFIWATNYGYLSTVLVPLGWFVWFLPAAAYASAPCFQVEATQRARQCSYCPAA